MMSGIERSGRRQACDSCRARKTRCNRQSPCSSCTTLDIQCTTTHRSPERRRRILLSSKHDDDIGEIHVQLRKINTKLESLLALNAGGRVLQREFLDTVPSEDISGPDTPTSSHPRENFKGDPSFDVCAGNIRSALEEIYTPQNVYPGTSVSESVTEVQRLLQNVIEPNSPMSADPSCGEQASVLPPQEDIIQILRLCRTKAQRLFVDIPFLDLDILTRSCQEVYFAIKPCSIWNWISVNVSLYYLVQQLNASAIVWSDKDRKKSLDTLEKNIDKSIRHLPLCVEPSIDACSALALSVTYYVRAGQSLRAWRLIAAASRAAMDIGLHRLPVASASEGHSIRQKRLLFWYIYYWDQGLAFSSGRTSTIHHGDVTTAPPADISDRSGQQQILYAAFMDHVMLTGEVRQELYSATATKEIPPVINGRAKRLINQLLAQQKHLQDIDRQDPTWDTAFASEAIMIDLMLQSLLVVIYKAMRSETGQQSPSMSCEEGVDCARTALTKLISAGNEMHQISPTGWQYLLNTILSLAPFVSIIVMVGNVVATRSLNDLAIIESAVSLLRLSAPGSATIHKVYTACEKFYKVTQIILTSNDHFPPKANRIVEDSVPNEIHEENWLPLFQRDWDNMMEDFGIDLNDFDAESMAGYLEPNKSTEHGQSM